MTRRLGPLLLALALVGCGGEDPADAPPEAPPEAPPPAAEHHVRDVGHDYGARDIGPIPAGRFTSLDGGNQTICALDDAGGAHAALPSCRCLVSRRSA